MIMDNKLNAFGKLSRCNTVAFFKCREDRTLFPQGQEGPTFYAKVKEGINL